jgi:hypothetical protein
MIKRILTLAATLTFAFTVLFVSILRTASVKYDFSGNVSALQNDVLADESVRINYNLAYPGKILPDHPLWTVKALRDRVWLWITTNPTRKAELKLLFADKRLGMSKILFEKGQSGIAFSILTKSEKYLEEAMVQDKLNRETGLADTDFLQTLSLSALKHREVIEQIYLIAPEDALPKIIQMEDYSRRVYEETMHALNENGMDAPDNPFDGE